MHPQPAAVLHRCALLDWTQQDAIATTYQLKLRLRSQSKLQANRLWKNYSSGLVNS